MSSMKRIIPFVRVLEPYLTDEAVTEIMVNDGGSRIFIERQGRIEQLSGVRIETVSLTAAIKNIFRDNGLEISEAQPARDARLEDGSRVTAVLAPISVTGPILTIRRHPRLFTIAQLVDLGMLTPYAAGLLGTAVAEGANVLISGRTGSGKTTLLNALAATLPDHERILLIEAPAEIAIQKPNLVRLEARLEELPLGQEAPLPPVSIGQLVRTALRLRPDRIVVGETRGADAWELLQCWNSGHSGSLSTIHANSAVLALTRFVHCVLMAQMNLPASTVREDLGDMLQYVVHVELENGQRRVREMIRVRGYERRRKGFQIEQLYGEETRASKRPAGSSAS
jgi:pilus assembly protein CpaF